jgi:N-acetylglucosamine-6-sulfatase
MVRSLLLLGALAVAAVLAGCGSSHPRPGAAPTTTGPTTTGPTTTIPIAARPGSPNIVFVLTDDLSDNLVSQRFMPNLWRLEHTGADFSHYFVTDSLCCPSRASILTGRYPHDTGVFNNSGADGGIGAFNRFGDDRSTVATDLRAVGYRTAIMGKYLNLYQPSDPPAPGWDQWDVTGNQGYAEFNYDLNENGRIVHYGGPTASTDNYLTDVLSGLADGFVSSSAARHAPFFLEVATYAPHTPYTPAPRYADLYPDLHYPRTPAYNYANSHAPGWLAHEPPLRTSNDALINEAFRKRAESVKSVDDMIGRLVTTLKRTGAWTNTYLVFSSDNGLHMGEHRLRPGKLTAFDTDINVPLVVVGPHVPERQVAAMAENVDLRPTFDAWAETGPNEGIDGRSLAPLLADGNVPAGWPTAVLIEHHGPDGDPNDPDYPARNSGNPTSYEALRTPHALYVEYADGEREYYDLATDPYELRNTIGALRAGRIAGLHAQLLALEQCHDRPDCTS